MSEHRQRRPAWLPLLAYLVIMPTMLWLGFWQLDKSGLQRQRNAEFAAADARALEVSAVSEPAALRYRRVVARGRYLGDRQLLIDNMVREGRNGFFVVTPLVLDDGSTLLVNRGWIPQTPRRAPVGDLEVSNAAREVAGRVGALPAGGLRLGEAAGTGDAWPRVLQFPTLDDVAAQLGRPVLPWVLLADPAAADGFARDWRPGGLPPERHLGYAVQWFAMALALTVIAVVVAVRGRREQEAT